MNCITRIIFLMQISFHRHRIHQYRLQGKKLIRANGQLVSPRLIELTRRVDHHGYMLYQLEKKFELAPVSFYPE